MIINRAIIDYINGYAALINNVENIAKTTIFTIDVKRHHTPPQRRQSPDAAPQQVQRPTIAVLVDLLSRDPRSLMSSFADKGIHNLHLKLEQYLKITTLEPL